MPDFCHLLPWLWHTTGTSARFGAENNPVSKIVCHRAIVCGFQENTKDF